MVATEERVLAKVPRAGTWNIKQMVESYAGTVYNVILIGAPLFGQQSDGPATARTQYSASPQVIALPPPGLQGSRRGVQGGVSNNPKKCTTKDFWNLLGKKLMELSV